jgi:hypothetical protein
MKSVKIRTLSPPLGDLSVFDPGEYLASLEFYETPDVITGSDRDDLAQFVQLLAYMALQAKSTRWAASGVRRETSAFNALESHFGGLEGWSEIVDAEGVGYGSLARFIFGHYPPHPPRR